MVAETVKDELTVLDLLTTIALHKVLVDNVLVLLCPDLAHLLPLATDE